eukprot:6832183-Prorocentrum_lima.AAC.1
MFAKDCTRPSLILRSHHLSIHIKESGHPSKEREYLDKTRGPHLPRNNSTLVRKGRGKDGRT